MDEIERAGGLSTWTPIEPIEDLERMWEYVQGYGRDGVERPPTRLLYGKGDPIEPAQHLMASALDGSDVYVTDGDHEWPTFTALWRHYLKSRPPWLREATKAVGRLGRRMESAPRITFPDGNQAAK